LTQTQKYATVLPKIGAAKSHLLSETKLKALSESQDLNEFAAQLRDTVYQEQISKLTSPLTGRKFERAFNENLIGTYLMLLKYLPKTAKPYIELYLARFQVEHIKMLIKATVAKLTPEQKIAKMYPAVEDYFGTREEMEEAAKASTLAQLIHALRNTEYITVLNMGMKSYETTGSTVSFDVFIDKLYYERLYAVFSELPRREKPYAMFFAKVNVDSFVLLTLLRAKLLGYDSNWLGLVVPHNYFKLSKRTVDSLVSALNFEAAYKIVEKTEYAKFFTRTHTPEETISNAERAFRQTVLEYAKSKAILELFDIGAVLIYLTYKETEVHNLITLALGIEATVPSEEIKNKLSIL
jgi:vacuolar-type H+-ATPase subunit C/Vma6